MTQASRVKALKTLHGKKVTYNTKKRQNRGDSHENKRERKQREKRRKLSVTLTELEKKKRKTIFDWKIYLSIVSISGGEFFVESYIKFPNEIVWTGISFGDLQKTYLILLSRIFHMSA